MRRVGKKSFAEIYFAGCNPGFLETSDGVVMIDSPQGAMDAMRWGERMREAGPIRYLVNTEPHGDHIQGNGYFPEAEVVGQRLLAAVFMEYLNKTADLPARIARAKTEDPDSVWLMDHPAYPPHPPTIVFDAAMTLEVGGQRIECIHMPGHTAPQTSVFLPEEGVVFTGDNVFARCKTWLQEADPWAWLDSLKRIEALDVETIVPGHGEPVGKDYLAEQAQIIENWLGYVGEGLDRGMTEDELLAQPLDVRRSIDPYPIAQRMFTSDDRVTTMNLRNLYRRVVGRRGERAA